MEDVPAPSHDDMEWKPVADGDRNQGTVHALPARIKSITSFASLHTL